MASSCNAGHSRRDFLKLGWSLGAGLVWPAALTGCGGGDGQTRAPEETFVEPATLMSRAGELDVTLELAYVNTTLDGKSVSLRSMNRSIPAPTLKVNAGDRLRINVVNRLPLNPASDERARHLRYPNSSNLHMHGLHVTPGLVSAGVYGDFVMDDPALGVQPGQSRRHEFRIAHDHPTGAYWYHPHLHGSTTLQVGSGMAGALIIHGDVDRVPEIAAAIERVFMFQAPIVNADGTVESLVQAVDDPEQQPPFLINGVRRPRLVMRSGEVQNWHFVNAATLNYLNLSLDGHVLHLHGFDGNPRADLLPIGNGSVDGIVLAPGNRASVLVQAGAPGRYALRTLPLQIASETTWLAEDVLAEVLVLEERRPMALPRNRLPVPANLAPISDEELASAGGLKRNIVMRAVFAQPTPAQQPDSVVHPGSEVDDWFYETGGTNLARTVFAIGSAGSLPSSAPGMPPEFVPFQSVRAPRQVVALNSVEEWTVFNMNAIRHPFHMHINPFQVVKINGEPIEPYWADTIGLPAAGSVDAPTSITFRIRFRDFSGSFVMHCHMLVHEDLGMMQMIEVV
jgi:FtsP/CotA-like multicopper oxidase with cupredoxin domain